MLPDDRLNLPGDTFDFNFGERLAVTVFLTVAFAAFFVKDDDFVAFNVAEHAGCDLGAGQIGGADRYITTAINKMHGVEGDRISFLSCQPVDEDLLTFLNFKLLTGDGNDCEHVENQIFLKIKNKCLSKGGQRYVEMPEKPSLNLCVNTQEPLYFFIIAQRGCPTKDI
jgi:hypothetical protein